MSDQSEFVSLQVPAQFVLSMKKIFSLKMGSVITVMEGHAEEVLYIKKVQYKGENYLGEYPLFIVGRNDEPVAVSTSEDGKVIKWKMSSDWT